jgi:hypothetical protein
MSNQWISWSMLIVPWLTLFFMPRRDIKRWMPVALLASVTSTMIADIGTALGFWAVREAAFPFNQMLPMSYGAMPVLTMWVFKFTYGRLWAYMITNIILDVGFSFFLLNSFLPGRGILDLLVSPVLALAITLMHAILLYGYQMWQDEPAASANRDDAPISLQPAAAKPLDKDKQDKQ